MYVCANMNTYFYRENIIVLVGLSEGTMGIYRGKENVKE
jgi:hypothetical protein